ncbi:VOC family protein [Thermohalobacter berrensis]|uniref:Glyoxalase n=1 Tax=Thermohalobacter berrensis TaxID=99594 RepID=A0A419SXQ9_9FIRM|nr:VOC family protein [Thermohalobacter berrensis]RKD30053.1 glyoxalase [Thermohalobacter berrensis]
MDIWEGIITFLGTKNLDKTDYFYNKILGLPLYKDQGKCKIYEVPDGGKLGFCTHISIVKQGKSPIITLLVEDVDRIYTKLTKVGFHPNPPKKKEQFNIYHFFMEDPNGYTLEIQKFID